MVPLEGSGLKHEYSGARVAEPATISNKVAPIAGVQGATAKGGNRWRQEPLHGRIEGMRTLAEAM